MSCSTQTEVQTMKSLLKTVVLVASVFAIPGHAAAQISDNVVKIGVIVDMTGVYSGQGGTGAVTAVQMAVKDFGGKVDGKPIEVVSADYQNKVDIAASKVRQWYDVNHVDMVIESTDSAAAIAMQKIAAAKKRIIIFAGAATDALTNKECSPYGIHYVYDTYALATGTGRAVMQQGGNTWFFLTADYAFGDALQAATSKVVTDMGGKVLGAIKHPLAAMDFASFLLQAQASKAKIVGLANSGKDTQNSIREAKEFGLSKGGQKLVPLLLFDTDIQGAGLEITQGLLFTTGFYWDYNDQTRNWSQRFYALHKTMPTMIQAGMYSATIHYLEAIQATGTDNSDTVMKNMKETPINDFFAQDGKILANGLMVHDMYLAEVKTPQESKSKWDIVKIKSIIPGAQAYQPLGDSTCSFTRK